VPSTLVIYNPTAGRGRVQEQWSQLAQILSDSGIDFEAAATRAPLDAMLLARHAPNKYARVIGVGGDGTLHEIANGLLQASGEEETIPMGLIPLGNGDDFAKVIPPEASIGGKPFDWQVAVQKIVRGQIQSIDAGRIVGDYLRPDYGDGAHYFINGMDVGFGALAARNFASTPKFLKGLSAYFAAILKTMIDYPTLHLRIQLDDLPPFDQSTTMTVITNGRCFGNGFWVCPDASVDDGFFDLMIAQAVSRLTILRMIPKLMNGTHVSEPIVRMARAQRVVIESDQPLVVETDGEIPFLSAHRLELDILPRKLRMIV
jgi:YegS/Rv2252/BmrU family lipid kinase